MRDGELLEDLPGEGGPLLVPLDQEVASLVLDADLEGVLEEAQVLVLVSEEGLDAPCPGRRRASSIWSGSSLAQRPGSLPDTRRIPRSRSCSSRTGEGEPVMRSVRARRLREGDDLAERRLPGQDHDHAVEAEGDAAVGRRAVLEGLEEEAEALPRLLVGEGEQLEDPGLERRVVDP